MTSLSSVIKQLQEAIKGRDINEILYFKRYGAYFGCEFVSQFYIEDLLNNMDESDYYFLNEVLLFIRYCSFDCFLDQYAAKLRKHLNAKCEYKYDILEKELYYQPRNICCSHGMTTKGPERDGIEFDPRIKKCQVLRLICKTYESNVSDYETYAFNTYLCEDRLIFAFYSVKLLKCRKGRDFYKRYAQISRYCYTMCRNIRVNIKQEIAGKLGF